MTLYVMTLIPPPQENILINGMHGHLLSRTMVEYDAADNGSQHVVLT